MRITYLLPDCTPDNSHGRYVIELARIFSARNNVAIYSGRFWEGLKQFAVCRRLPVVQRPLLAKIVSSWLASLALSRRGREEIVHVQGADGIIGNVVTAHFCNQAVRPLLDASKGYYSKFNYALGSLAERHSMNRQKVRRLIAVSSTLRKDLVREYAIDPAKITVVSHGVDVEEFHPGKRKNLRQNARSLHGFRDDDFVLLFIGGDYVLKGLLSLLEALRELPTHVKVLAVGVKQDYGLAQFLAAERLGDRVRFCNRTEGIISMYAAADCFVLPTRYESFSLVTLEAMAVGLPVLVSRLAGVSEVLTDGVDSRLLQDPTDCEELANLLNGLIADSGKRDRLATAARATAEAHPWTRVATETLNVYKEVLADR